MSEKGKNTIPDQRSSHCQLDHTILSYLSQSARGSDSNRPVNTSELASYFKLTPSCLLSCLRRCEQYGVEFAVLDEEYCQLRQPLDLLDVTQIYSALQEKNTADGLPEDRLKIDFQPVIDSTNRYLLDIPKEDTQLRVCLAEFQTAGKGRYGKHWVAPYASGLCLSLSTSLPVAIERRQLVSLLPGIALMRLLKRLELDQYAGLKWPNDLLCRDLNHGIDKNKKLAGVLTEVSPELAGQHRVVFGIGINVYNDNHRSHTAMMSAVHQPWLALSDLAGKEQVLSRNRIAACLISEHQQLLRDVKKKGMASLLEEWRSHDLTRDQWVKLIWPDHEIQGIARGISDEGTLLLEVDGELKQFSSGEVSLRFIKDIKSQS